MAVTDTEMENISLLLDAGDVVINKIDWAQYNDKIGLPDGLCQERETEWTSATVQVGKKARLTKTYPNGVNHKSAGLVSGSEWFFEDV